MWDVYRTVSRARSGRKKFSFGTSLVARSYNSINSSTPCNVASAARQNSANEMFHQSRSVNFTRQSTLRPYYGNARPNLTNIPQPTPIFLDTSNASAEPSGKPLRRIASARQFSTTDNESFSMTSSFQSRNAHPRTDSGILIEGSKPKFSQAVDCANESSYSSVSTSMERGYTMASRCQSPLREEPLVPFGSNAIRDPNTNQVLSKPTRYLDPRHPTPYTITQPRKSDFAAMYYGNQGSRCGQTTHGNVAKASCRGVQQHSGPAIHCSSNLKRAAQANEPRPSEYHREKKRAYA